MSRDLRGAADVRVVGFLDDNPRLRRRRVQGVPVLGSIGDAPAVLESTHSDELVVTIPDAEAGRLDAVVGPARPPASRIASSASAPARSGDDTGPRRVSPEVTAAPLARASTSSDARARVEGIVPLVGAYLLLATLFAWQAWRRETPTIFSDELETTQISRAIAETGHAARRGESYGFTSLVPWLTAPLWWLHPVATAYEAIKTVQAFVMAAAIFPAYLLARRVVSPGWAYFAAVAAIAGPALSYSPILVEEPWAYPAATLALWLTVRAVDAPGTVVTGARVRVVPPGGADPLAARGAVRRARLRARRTRVADGGDAALAGVVDAVGLGRSGRPRDRRA